MGVGCSKPTRWTQRRIERLNPSDSKVFSVVSTGCCGIARLCMTLAYSRFTGRQASAPLGAAPKADSPGVKLPPVHDGLFFFGETMNPALLKSFAAAVLLCTAPLASAPPEAEAKPAGAGARAHAGLPGCPE